MSSRLSFYLKDVQSETPVSRSNNLQFYQNIFDTSCDLIAILDFKGNIQTVNPALQSTLSWEKGSEKGQNILSFLHPADREIVENDFKKFSSRKRSYSFRGRLKDRKGVYLNMDFNLSLDHANKLICARGKDVTEGEKAKSELQLAAKMLEETNRIALVGGWEYHRITQEVNWTSVTREIHEIDKDYPVTYENTIQFFREGENRRIIEHLMHNAIHFNRPFDVELEIITAKHNHKWVRVKGQPVFEGKKCVKLIGTLQDIDKEKKNQFHLERINTHLQAIMEASTEAAIIALDITGTIMYFNSGAEMLLGYGAEEVVGKKTPLIFHLPEDLQKKAEKLSTEYKDEVPASIECLTYKSKRGDVDTQEYTYICRDDSRIEVEVSITPIKNNHNVIIGYVSIGLDVSEKKEKERRLIDSETRSRILFETSQVVLYTHDLDGNFLSMNPRGTNLLGYTEKEIINRNILDIVPLESQKSLPEYLRELTENGRSKGLMQIVDREGRRITWMYHNILAEYTDGTRYVIGNVVDITDRIELENDLKLAKQAAEQNAQMKEMFLANMSHEIRTPMNAITGFGRLLCEGGNLTEEQQDYVNAINTASSNLLNLINDILDFSKIESGEIKLEKIPFSLKDQINYVWKILSPNAHQKGLLFKCMVDHGMPEMVIGDPTRLSQVLVNLINNAIKFTEKGHIRLLVQTLEKTNNGYVIEFQVEDTGIGIPEEKIQAVFDRFTQANTNTTRKYGGTGLGLSISKSLIELQGGEIEVESHLNKGSRFTFRLPFQISNEIHQTDSPIESLPVEAPKKNNLLLVEDNMLNQKLAKKVMELRGFNVDVAENGIIALEMLKTRSYDLILMDLQMPEMDGYQTADHIRNTMKLDTPIMAMTAHSLVGEKEKCLRVGMNEYITKPFDPNTLFLKIKELTEQNDDDSDNNKPKEAAVEKVDLSYLKLLSDNNKEFEKEILQTSMYTIPADLDLLHHAVNELDHTQIKASAHKLRSSFLTIGLDVQEELETLEFKDITEFKTLEAIYYEIKQKYLKTRKALEVELATNY